MKKECILHTPMSNYMHALDDKHLLFRIRTARNDITSCKVYIANSYCPYNPIDFKAYNMEVAASDEYFDYFQAVVEDEHKRTCYYFELSDGKETILYYSDMVHTHTVDERFHYYKMPYNRPEDIIHIPDWFKNANVYNVFPDSFATSKRFIKKEGCEKTVVLNGEQTTTHSRLGGTINGVTENLDYIQSLGIDCIYLNPIFSAGEWHKYDLTDYFSIDPCFGTNDDFKKLVQACHSRNMHIIIDGVFNHCGWNFFAFNDCVKNGKKSRYWNWFYHLEEPVVKPKTQEEIPTYECFGYERKMPKMNTGNPEVMEYFLKVCRYWISEYDIDGWRLDVADEINSDFWRNFRKAAKECKKDCVIIGEVWQTAPYWLDGTMFDSTMNYDFMKHCRAFFGDRDIDSKGFEARVTHMLMRYRTEHIYGQLNLLDSHDVPRFLSQCYENIKAYKLAVVFQYTFVGVPSLFYGDEQGFKGIEEADYRRPMEFNDDGMFIPHVKALAMLRKNHEALRKGTFKTLFAPNAGRVFGFERKTENERIIVVINNDCNTADISLFGKKKNILLEQGFCEAKNTIKPWGFIIFEA